MDLKSKYRNVYSQFGEDGLLEYLLAALNIQTGTVCEVGAWDGLRFSNTAHLWKDRGFSAVLIESTTDRYQELVQNTVLSRDVHLVRAEVAPTGPTSLNALLAGRTDLAVLSIDVDGIDYSLFEALSVRPAIVVIEVNSTYGPDEDRVDAGGASFAAMNRLARFKGYRLVDHTGNCIYVREDLAEMLDLAEPERSRFSCWAYGTTHRWWRPKFLPVFVKEYEEKLIQPAGANPVRDRRGGFRAIFSALDALPPERPIRILETGCIRPDHGDLCFGDDGCATVLFDHFAIHTGAAKVLSVDLDPEHVAYARGKVRSGTTQVVCSDSVPYLHATPATEVFDLVYLDSFDIDRGNPIPAQVHHLKELAAVLKNTRPGTILAVDDCDAFFDGGKTGKGTYVTEYLAQVGAELLCDGYQRVWRLR